MTTNSTLNGAQLRPDIPQKAVNLGKRTIQALKDSDNGRITIEIIEAPDGSWLVFVNNGKLEELR